MNKNILGEEANNIDLSKFKDDEFWKEISTKKIITIGTPIEFQTVAYNLVPQITDGNTDVVSDKVAKMEYKREEKFANMLLKTFGDFAALMRSTGSWMKIDSNTKYLGDKCPITIAFEKPYSSYKPTDDADNVFVNVYNGKVDENNLDKIEPWNKDKPIPVNVLFLDTYRTEGGAKWFKEPFKTKRKIGDNIFRYLEGEIKDGDVKTNLDTFTIGEILNDFKPKLVSNIYYINIPFGNPYFVIKFPYVKESVLLKDITKFLVTDIKNNIEEEINYSKLYEILYNEEERRDDQSIINYFKDYFQETRGGDQYVEMTHTDKMRQNADAFLNSPKLFFESAFDNSNGVIERKTVDGIKNCWVYTLRSSRKKYTIFFEYNVGEPLTTEGRIIIQDDEGKRFRVKSGIFFSEDLVTVYKTPSGKNFKIYFKRSLYTWWKGVAASTGTNKMDIKLENVKPKNSYWEDYWKKKNFIQEDNSEYWKNYWKEMGF